MLREVESRFFGDVPTLHPADDLDVTDEGLPKLLSRIEGVQVIAFLLPTPKILSRIEGVQVKRPS